MANHILKHYIRFFLPACSHKIPREVEIRKKVLFLSLMVEHQSYYVVGVFICKLNKSVKRGDPITRTKSGFGGRDQCAVEQSTDLLTRVSLFHHFIV